MHGDSRGSRVNEQSSPETAAMGGPSKPLLQPCTRLLDHELGSAQDCPHCCAERARRLVAELDRHRRAMQAKH